MRNILTACLALASATLSAATVDVQVGDFFFDNNDISIQVGDTVRWTWAGSAPHSVISNSGAEPYSSSTFTSGTFSHTFTQTGNHPYYCGVHGLGMAGVVRVLVPVTPTFSPTATPSPTETLTPSVSPTITPTFSPSPSATVTPTLTASLTPLTGDVDVTGTLVLYGGQHYQVNSFVVRSGAFVQVSSTGGQAVTVTAATDLVVEDDAFIMGQGWGFNAGMAPGKGADGTGNGGGGGGGHYATGAAGGAGAAGGSAYGSLTAPVLPGSPGGASANGAAGGGGGAALVLHAVNMALSGTVSMIGLGGQEQAGQFGGGGSGGSLQIRAQRIWGDALLSVRGGPGLGSGPGAAGGGSGGILQLCATVSDTFGGFKLINGVPAVPTPTPGMVSGPSGAAVDCSGVSVFPGITYVAAVPPPGRLALLGPVPVAKGRPLCLGLAGTPAGFSVELFNSAGERAGRLSGAAVTATCLETGALSPGIYFARIEAELADGRREKRWQKVAIIP